MSTNPNYSVETEPYAERHYIKDFSKKFKVPWDITYTALCAEIARIDAVISETDRADVIRSKNDCKLVKLYFRVAGTRESAKGSGNRVIIHINETLRSCRVLIVYSKNHIGPPKETQKWESAVKSNYPKLWKTITKDPQ